MRSIILFYKQKIEAFLIRFRVVFFWYFFKNYRIIIGKNLQIHGGKGSHSFGDDLVIYDNVIFEVFSDSAVIQVGKKCILSYGVIVSCSKKIKIGDNVWIGEYTSIRDSTHVFTDSTPLGEKPDYVENITIGNNVWIGRGSIILPGTVIEDNVVIGANSVVRGKCESNSVYAGTPVLLKKKL